MSVLCIREVMSQRGDTDKHRCVGECVWECVCGSGSVWGSMCGSGVRECVGVVCRSHCKLEVDCIVPLCNDHSYVNLIIEFFIQLLIYIIIEFYILHIANIMH